MSEQPENDYQGLVLWGAPGNVGTQLVEDVTTKNYPKGENWGDQDPTSKYASKIICIVDRTHFYIDADGISASDLHENGVKSLLEEKGTEYNNPMEVMEAVKSRTAGVLSEDAITHVDITDGPELKPVYDEVLHNTESSMVAVNKGVLANATQEEFREYVKHGKLELKSTVGAGANAVDVCLNSVEIGIPITEITATLSGTCGKLSNALNSQEFRDGKIQFSDITTGLYPDDTEPHPHTDFSGEDVKKKITILALAAGYHVSMKGIKVENPIVPDEYLDRFPTKTDVPDYLNALAELDEQIRKQAEAAHKEGKVLVYLAKMRLDKEGKPVLTVGFEALDPTGKIDTDQVTDEEKEAAQVQAGNEADIAAAKNNIIILKDEVETQSMQKPGSGGAVTSKSAMTGINEMIAKRHQVA